MSKESIKLLAISDNLNPGINYNDNGKILSKIWWKLFKARSKAIVKKSFYCLWNKFLVAPSKQQIYTINFFVKVTAETEYSMNFSEKQ